jgi:hypothetical protein
MVGHGNKLRLIFKDEAYEREKIASNVNTKEFYVYVDTNSYNKHAENFLEYYKYDRLHLITYDMINEYFGDRFTMPKYIYNMAKIKMDCDAEHEFNRSIIEMLLDEDEDQSMDDFLYQTLGEVDKYFYNSALYNGIEGVEMGRMEYMYREEDGVPDYFVVPIEM